MIIKTNQHHFHGEIDPHFFGNLAFDKFEKSQISHIFSANQRQFQKFHTILLINFQGILQEIARKCLNQLQHFGT